MTQQVGRRSHRGFYRKTKDISESAAEAIRKWGFRTEIHRQTACVAFTKGDRTFFWHPVKKQFRPQGSGHDWVRLPPGKGIVALMLHLFAKEQLPNITQHFGGALDNPPRPAGAHETNTDNPIDFPSAAAERGSRAAAGSARASTGEAGEPESQSVGHARAENFARRSANEQRAGGPPQMDDYDYEDPMTFEDGGAHWGSDS